MKLILSLQANRSDNYPKDQDEKGRLKGWPFFCARGACRYERGQSNDDLTHVSDVPVVIVGVNHPLFEGVAG